MVKRKNRIKKEFLATPAAQFWVLYYSIVGKEKWITLVSEGVNIHKENSECMKLKLYIY